MASNNVRYAYLHCFEYAEPGPEPSDEYKVDIERRIAIVRDAKVKAFPSPIADGVLDSLPLGGPVFFRPKLTQAAVLEAGHAVHRDGLKMDVLNLCDKLGLDRDDKRNWKQIPVMIFALRKRGLWPYTLKRKKYRIGNQ